MQSFLSHAKYVEKKSFDCCAEPIFNRYLVRTRPQIFLMGMEAHICVLQTALTLMDKDKDVFVVEDGGVLGKNLKSGWSRKKDLDMRGNVFSGNISQNFIDADLSSTLAEIKFEGKETSLSTYAVTPSLVKNTSKSIADHPIFPAAGKGIFKHITEKPEFDIFGNSLDAKIASYGAGY